MNTLSEMENQDFKFHTYFKQGNQDLSAFKLNPRAATSRPWFYANELATIYQFPLPSPTAKPVVGVLSFGGGLYGSVDANGIVTNGDCQQYWSLCGINSNNFPTVVLKTIAGATNNPSDPSTPENTLDVQTIGGVCPTSNLTIILYIAPNSLNNFTTLMNYMLNSNVNVRGVDVKPSIISISWGAPEIYFGSSLLTNINTQFQTAVAKGINITVATGDNGSSDGYGPPTSSYADFPSSSPNVIAVGGTNLICPNRIYDSNTKETAWTSGGGAASAFFSKPTYQLTKVSGTFRRNADVASVADPNTGVLFVVNGQQVVYGGTSVAAPTVAGFLATFNCSKWANPILYPAASSNFNDIVVGSNGAYVAQVGWDNCTGLGSLRGLPLKNLLTASSSVINVTGITVSPTTANLNPTKTVQISAVVFPTNATNKIVLWSTSAPSVATVNYAGLVTAVGNGTCTITACTQDGGFAANTTINVTTKVTGVTVTPQTVTLKVGKSQLLTPTVQPLTASNKTVRYTTSNTTIASLVGNTVVAKKVGKATITVTTVDGSFVARCAVTIVA